MNRNVRLTLALLTCLAGSLSNGQCDEKPAFDDASLEFFEKEVRPIFETRCYECHAGGGGAVKGGLRLDSRDAIFKGGDTGSAVNLENPTSSLLLSAINYGDIYQMPPKSKMPANEIAVLTKWVEMGLPWPKENSAAAGTVKPFDLAARAAEHWCWQPVKDYAPPNVQQKEWPVSDTDRFILAGLESKGLGPAAPADRRALLRRVYFDLIGLPPSPSEVEEFVRDHQPNAFANVVDRLLDSLQFGERWGRHWLDLTRYAETRGHEFEPVIPNAWHYRDYVIRALNDDVPYDRFLAEHLAGDLLEPRWRNSADHLSNSSLPINESVLGTAFWFLGEEVHSPVDIRKDETDRMDNRLDVLSKTFLGLTVACARCHDHKFDAISQRDYYALAGFALSGSYRQIRIDTFEQHRRIAEQLDELRANWRQGTAAAIATATRPVIEKLDRYWLAAKRVLDESTIGSDALSSAKSLDGAITTLIDQLSAEYALDSRLLTRWCVELKSAKDDKRHPLNTIFDTGPHAILNASDRRSNPLRSDAVRKGIANGASIVVDFSDIRTNPPIQDGVSFGLRPVERGQLIIDGSHEAPTVRIATIGGWQRDLFWKNNTLSPGTEVDNGTLGSYQAYGRMVRSPEFTLTSRNVWSLVRGSVRAYACVNSHLIVVGPLHGGVFREFKHDDDQWHWVSHGLENYSGHRMHLEFSPIDNAPCTIAMVVQSDEKPKLPEPDWSGLIDGTASIQSPSERIAAYHKAFQEAVNTIADLGTHGRVENSKSIDRPDASHSSQPDLANWMMTHPQLFSVVELELPKSTLHEAEAEIAKRVRWDSSLAPVILDGNGVDEYLLVRGNSNLPKEPVTRRFLDAFHGSDSKSATNLHSIPAHAIASNVQSDSKQSDNHDSKPDDHFNHGSGRLELAREILRSPLVSRVAVNRIWHHLFGRGIVPTVDNMGRLGQPPSHPELLDHLATRFSRTGWSTKAMIRSLVLSRTYQMSSQPCSSDSVDPDNTFWHRMPIKRLEGEVIRDSLLAVSGRLDLQSYGPSVPIHLTEFMQGRGRPGTSGPLDGNGRRSIYIAVRRNFLSPMMLAFDTPSPFSTVGRRTVSNVPAQALILMNDPFVIEQAKRWADRLLSETSRSTEQRVDEMYLTAFARHASAAEISESREFLDSVTKSGSGTERDAWANLCHVMFNVKEFVFVD